MSNDPLSFGNQILASQPFSVLLQAELVAFSEGYAEIKIPIREQLQQQHGFLHGGVISYAADNALTFAGGSVLGTAVLTAEFKINYLRPGAGDFLLAKARLIHAGKRQAVCRCEVFALSEGEEELIAVAQGAIVKTA